MYYRNKDALNNLSIAKVSANIQRQYEALVAKLMDFCRNRFDVEWTRKQTEHALLSYLQSHSVSILATALGGQSLLDTNERVKHSEFLVNAFIKDLFESDAVGFDFLEAIVKGSMLACELYFPGMSESNQSFDQLQVYFDTPFLLRALGYAGREIQQPYRELIDLLYGQNVEMRCFDHTYREMLGVLDAVAGALQRIDKLRDAYGEVLGYFVEKRRSASDIEFIISQLPKVLKGFHIEIEQKPLHQRQMSVDEERLESILKEEVRYIRQEALNHDLDALTAIHHLRKGRIVWPIESCEAIFITTNESLARAGVRFFMDVFANNMSIPLCMHHHSFTTIVWLKNPMKAPDLPRKRIISDCYAALNPSDNLWRIYLEEIDQLQQNGDISEEDYNILRFSMAARREIMSVTLGDPEAIVEGTVKQILENAQVAIRRDVENRAAKAEALIENQLQRFQCIGAQFGKWITRLIQGGGILFITLFVFLTIPKPYSDIFQKSARLIFPGTLLLVLILLISFLIIANLSRGSNLYSFVKRIEIFISRFVERTLIRIAGIQKETDKG